MKSVKFRNIALALILTSLLSSTLIFVAAQEQSPTIQYAAKNPPNHPNVVAISPQNNTQNLDTVTAPTTEWTYHKSTDGAHPDGQEQQVMWLMNRARADPTQEGIWLATSTETDVADGRDYFGVDLALLQSEFAGYTAKPPAAFDVRLYNAAKAHSDDLIARDAQDHNGQYDRVTAAGFSPWGYRGSVFAYSDNSLNAHAAWNIDWGPDDPDDGDGMQASRGHRKAIMSIDGDYTNVGVALVYEGNAGTSVGPYVATGNYCFADSSATDHYNQFIVGTVWNDQNSNDRYDPGEGLSGVTVTPDSGTYYAVTGDSGGYAIPINAGTYTVTFSGAASSVKSVTVNSESVLLDLITSAIQAPTAPSNLAISLTAPETITLTWTDNSDNEEGFRIERSDDGSTGWTQVGTVGIDATTYRDSNLTCETTYYYRAVAYNAGGDSAYSNIISGATGTCPPTSPNAPNHLSVSLTSHTAITLTWNDNSDNETSFEIERSSDGNTGWTQIGTVITDIVTFGDTGLTENTTVYYRVRAVNDVGSSDFSNVAQATTDAFIGIHKAADTGGLSQVPLGGIVTYTLTFSNTTNVTLTTMMLTDTLPSDVTFRELIGYSGSDTGLPTPGTVNLPPAALLWQPGDLAGGDVYTLVFSVNITNNEASMGHTVVNTVIVNANNASVVNTTANFQIERDTYMIFLPLVLRNYPPTYTISGNITDDQGANLAGVTVADDAGHTTTTDANGNFALSDLLAGTYTLTPSKDGHTFSPPTTTFTVPPDVSAIGFVGTPTTPPLQRLIVFEAFFDPGCGLCQNGAGIIRDQLVSEYANDPVLFLEYNLNDRGPRYYRWWDGYAVGGSVYLPLTMVDSGNQVKTGAGISDPGLYVEFKEMLDNALATPEGQAEILATAQKSGNRITANIQVTNRGNITLGGSNNATVWLLVYEEFDTAPVTDRLTKRYVRAEIGQTIVTDIAPDASQTFNLETADLSGVDWNRLHAVALVDYRPNPSERPYNTYQAIAVNISQ